jgi:predicted RNA binding protein YcfA (HicA-like mRNA interferase family)
VAAPLPVLKAKIVIRALERGGFFVHHQTGSHAQLRHARNPERRVTVPCHNVDVPKAILASILRQAGLSVDEFLDLL